MAYDIDVTAARFEQSGEMNVELAERKTGKVTQRKTECGMDLGEFVSAVCEEISLLRPVAEHFLAFTFPQRPRCCSRVGGRWCLN